MKNISKQTAPFSMPELPYAPGALAPHISAETIEYHYGKHLQTYVDNLNKLVVGSGFEGAELKEILKNASGALLNNAAQVWNHTLYFSLLSPTPKSKPTSMLAATIGRDFGSYEAFVEQFTASALGLFGSGWTWLVEDKAGRLSIENTSNAGIPMADGRNALVVVDVWEHAYYIDYRNARAKSLEAFWKVLNWEVAEQRFAK